MNLSLDRVKRILPDSEYQVVRDVVRASSLPESDISRIRPLVRGWRTKYVDRAHRQAREARKNARPRSTRGAESNENTMRQADIMAWVLDRLDEFESAAADAQRAASTAASGSKGGDADRSRDAGAGVPTREAVVAAIGESHVSTFGDLWAEFPEAPVSRLRKILWSLVEAGEVDLTTAGGIELSSEEEIAFVEEVQEIAGVPVKGRSRSDRVGKGQKDHFARTKVVRINAHNRARGARNQAKRDRRGGR